MGVNYTFIKIDDDSKELLFPISVFFCAENDVENADPQKGGGGARTRKVIFKSFISNSGISYCNVQVGSGSVIHDYRF